MKSTSPLDGGQQPPPRIWAMRAKAYRPGSPQGHMAGGLTPRLLTLGGVVASTALCSLILQIGEIQFTPYRFP